MNIIDPSTESFTEPLLDSRNERLTAYPLDPEYSEFWKLYKQHEKAFWTPGEIDYSTDQQDWLELTDNERYFIKMVLAFFAASDGIVNMNLVERFQQEIQITEAKFFYGFQAAMENIHSETYSMMIDVFIKDDVEKAKAFKAVENFPAIKKKAEWAKNWIESDKSFAHRVVAFAAVEGIFFSGSFCSIFWLKKRNKMKALCHANELISRDEALHCKFACAVNSKIVRKLSEATIQSIIGDAVTVEKEFIIESLPCALLGMNAVLMSQYIEYVADVLLGMLGCSKLYNSNNPFDFMERISLENKTNFFERRVSEYGKSGSNREDDSKFDLEADF